MAWRSGVGRFTQTTEYNVKDILKDFFTELAGGFYHMLITAIVLGLLTAISRDLGLFVMFTVILSAFSLFGVLFALSIFEEAGLVGLERAIPATAVGLSVPLIIGTLFGIFLSFYAPLVSLVGPLLWACLVAVGLGVWSYCVDRKDADYWVLYERSGSIRC